MSHNWTTFKKQVFIDAGLADVFNAWVIPQEITKWFIAEATYTHENQQRNPDETIQCGDRYHWRWHQPLEAKGTIMRVVPNKQLVFTFGQQSPESSEDILVTVDVAREPDGYTKLTLTQENMPDSPYGHRYHLSCNLGWSFFMTNLKGVLEHGVDLRETDPDRAEAARAISVTG